MPSKHALLVAATRQAALIACAVVGGAAAAAAQTTYKLQVSAIGRSVEENVFYNGTAQVTSDPHGINCRSELVGGLAPTGACIASFPAGTQVTLTATPLFGGTFNGWTGACAGQGSTCLLEMTADRAVATKTTAKTFTLTIRGTGNASGAISNTDLFANPRLGCRIDPGGQTSGTCVTEYPSNQLVWLNRDIGVNSPARFVGYTGCGSDPNSDPNECRFIIEGPTIVTAGWIAPEILVSSSGGEGSGRVTGVVTTTSVSVLDCTLTGSAANGTCTKTWDQAPPPSSVTLTATPAVGSVFEGWSGKCSGTGPCVISLTGRADSLKVSARFGVLLSSLTITSAGSGNGRITSDPAQVDCFVTGGNATHNCSGLFAPGTTVKLIADPTGGSTFGGWSAACSGTQLTCTLAIDGSTQVTAQFVAPRPAAQLALALLGRLTISDEEQRQLDRFGNKDDVFNLGDLLALLARTGERLPISTMQALLSAPSIDAAAHAARRNP